MESSPRLPLASRAALSDGLPCHCGDRPIARAASGSVTAELYIRHAYALATLQDASAFTEIPNSTCAPRTVSVSCVEV